MIAKCTKGRPTSQG